MYAQQLNFRDVKEQGGKTPPVDLVLPALHHPPADMEITVFLYCSRFCSCAFEQKRVPPLRFYFSGRGIFKTRDNEAGRPR